jgi:hypothetical protein
MKKRFAVVIILGFTFLISPFLSHAYSILFGPSLFTPRTDDIDYFKSDKTLYVNPNSPDNYFTAPVFLPQGSTVTSLVIFFWDNSEATLEVRLKKVNVYNGNEITMCFYSSQGVNPGWQTAKIANIWRNRINNDGYIYVISVWFSRPVGNELAFRAIKINYNLLR